MSNDTVSVDRLYLTAVELRLRYFLLQKESDESRRIYGDFSETKRRNEEEQKIAKFRAELCRLIDDVAKRLSGGRDAFFLGALEVSIERSKHPLYYPLEGELFLLHTICSTFNPPATPEVNKGERI
jgi:hypothetical protein